VASVGPALLGWLFVIMPAVISAQDSGASVSGAYLLAASQTPGTRTAVFGQPSPNDGRSWKAKQFKDFLALETAVPLQRTMPSKPWSVHGNVACTPS
jgi:hypothetical protein